MPDSWQRSLLADLVDIRHGFAFGGKFIHDEPYGDVLLTPGNFAVGGGFKGEKFKYYDGPIPEGYVLQEDDLLVSMTDLSKLGDTLGYSAVVPARADGRRYLHNQRLGKVVVRQQADLDATYLHYLLRCPSYRQEVLASATGTTVKHTSPDRIRRFQFDRPPLCEQRAIAHILGTLDDKIELNRRMSETLEAMARALFKSWFVDFDPVRAKHEGRNTGLPKHVADLFPDALTPSELGQIPRGWHVAPIGTLANVVGGSTPSTSEPRYWNGGTYHWATPKDLAGLTVPVLLGTERHITEEGLAQISSGLLPAGTVLLSSRAPIGYLAVAEIPVAINQGFIALKPAPGTSNLFLLFWASAAHENILSRANGSTFLEISKGSFRPIPVVEPPTALMERFDQSARPVFQRVVACERETSVLSALRDTLLPKLISGEIRVRNAEKVIGATV